MANKLCQKCGKMLDEDTQFYTYKNGEKTEMCKKCLTMHIDNWDPSTYLWLLEKMDVPYVPVEWDVLRDRAFAKNPNLNGMSVFGKYLSKMKLKQWKNYGWADSDRLQALNEEKRSAQDAERAAFDAEIKEKFEAGEISEAEYKTMVSAQTQHEEYVNAPIMQPNTTMDRYYDENTSIVNSQLDNSVAQLTSDDKIYLAMKWGALYKPQEWIELERSYEEMTNSFDIQDADTINTLILICKTNLKMNQALDCGDIEGFQKLSKVSESLRKSAKFTAAQNKEEKNDYVDCVGELVAMCEREGYIPRFETDIPQDKVDLTLKDMKNYLYKLVTQDLGFGQQIEDALKKIQIQKEMAETETVDPESDEEAIQGLKDAEIAEYYNSIEEQRMLDADLFNSEEEQ
mgnify:FL=1